MAHHLQGKVQRLEAISSVISVPPQTPTRRHFHCCQTLLPLYSPSLLFPSREEIPLCGIRSCFSTDCYNYSLLLHFQSWFPERQASVFSDVQGPSTVSRLDEWYACGEINTSQHRPRKQRSWQEGQFIAVPVLTRKFIKTDTWDWSSSAPAASLQASWKSIKSPQRQRN
jgi:hypothetical protein